MLELKVNEQSVFNIDTIKNNISVNGNEVSCDIIKLTDNSYNIIKDDKSYNVEVISLENKSYKLRVNGNEYAIDVKDELDLLLTKMGISNSNLAIENDLKAPMPGLVLDIKVDVGQEIKKGDPVLVLVAMKMENILKAPADVIIKSINAKKDENVDKNTVLVEFE